MRFLPFLYLTVVSSCGGIAWNNTVADDFAVRRAMVESLEIGQTTETQWTTRWGRPVQKVREAAQTHFLYRNLKDEKEGKLFFIGESTEYVIVSFQYGQRAPSEDCHQFCLLLAIPGGFLVGILVGIMLIMTIVMTWILFLLLYWMLAAIMQGLL